jgi:hypothetical protein
MTLEDKLETLILNSDSLEVVAEKYLDFKYMELFIGSAVLGIFILGILAVVAGISGAFRRRK